MKLLTELEMWNLLQVIEDKFALGCSVMSGDVCKMLRTVSPAIALFGALKLSSILLCCCKLFNVFVQNMIPHETIFLGEG